MTLTMKYKEALDKNYYNPRSPGAFGSVQRVYQTAKQTIPGITVDDVKDYLKSQITYVLHRSARRKIERNRMTATKPNEHWQSDLVDMSAYAKSNEGYNFIITTIDIFSKKASAVPVRHKNQDEMAKAFETIFKHSSPENLMTDRGTEFLNKPVQEVFRKHMVNHFTSRLNSPVKAAVCERFNRTLKSRMFKYFTSKGTRRWLEILDDLLDGYNNSFHRSIGMAPNEVNNLNISLVRNRLNSRKIERSLETRIIPNDTVRIQYKSEPLDKGYYPNWQDPLYTVEKISRNTDGRPMFKIKDYLGRVQKNKYYSEELQKSRKLPYRIEKILKRDNKNKRVLVKWLGYGNEHNSWEPMSAVKNV